MKRTKIFKSNYQKLKQNQKNTLLIYVRFFLLYKNKRNRKEPVIVWLYLVSDVYRKSRRRPPKKVWKLLWRFNAVSGSNFIFPKTFIFIYHKIIVNKTKENNCEYTFCCCCCSYGWIDRLYIFVGRSIYLIWTKGSKIKGLKSWFTSLRFENTSGTNVDCTVNVFLIIFWIEISATMILCINVYWSINIAVWGEIHETNLNNFVVKLNDFCVCSCFLLDFFVDNIKYVWATNNYLHADDGVDEEQHRNKQTNIWQCFEWLHEGPE